MTSSIDLIPIRGSFAHCRVEEQQCGSTKKMYILKSSNDPKILGAFKYSDFLFNCLETDPLFSFFAAKKISLLKSDLGMTLTTEYLGTDLERFLREEKEICSLERAVTLAPQICNVLAFLESKKILYPTLYPKDFSLTSDGKTLKIGNLDHAYLNTTGISPFKLNLDCIPITRFPYLSAAVLSHKPLTTKTPLWNMGIIIAEIFYTKLQDFMPLKRSLQLTRIETTLQAIARLTQQNQEKVQSLLNFLKKLITEEDKRPTATQVLTDPFIQETGFAFNFPPTTNNQALLSYSHIPENDTDLLGSGTFGMVQSGLTAQGIPCALKKSKESNIHSWENESLLLSLFTGVASIIQRYDSFTVKNTTDNTLNLYISFEKMEANLRTSLERRKSLPLDTIASYGRQLSEALLALERVGVIHLDIKPENILVSKDLTVVKLADFGSFCFAKSAHLLDSLYQVTREYRPPELLLEITPELASDMWSLGTTLLECFLLDITFPKSPESSTAELFSLHEHRLEKKYPAHLLSQASTNGLALYSESSSIVPPPTAFETIQAAFDRQVRKTKANAQQADSFKDLILRMLSYDRNDRPTPTQALAHPFLSENPSTSSSQAVPAVETTSSGRVRKRPKLSDSKIE